MVKDWIFSSYNLDQGEVVHFNYFLSMLQILAITIGMKNK